jgi:hypothetical protein
MEKMRCGWVMRTLRPWWLWALAVAHVREAAARPDERGYPSGGCPQDRRVAKYPEKIVARKGAQDRSCATR